MGHRIETMARKNSNDTAGPGLMWFVPEQAQFQSQTRTHPDTEESPRESQVFR